jgi:hypothetical protein
MAHINVLNVQLAITEVYLKERQLYVLVAMMVPVTLLFLKFHLHTLKAMSHAIIAILKIDGLVRELIIHQSIQPVLAVTIIERLSESLVIM